MNCQKACYRLYQETFHDSKAFADQLFLQYYDSGCRILQRDGQVVSMLFLLPMKLMDGRNAQYLFGAATDRRCRGKGYMSELINRVLEANGCPLFLRPAAPDLRKFYQKFGFRDCIKMKTLHGCAKKTSAQIFEITDVSEYGLLRQRFGGADTVITDDQLLSLAVTDMKVVSDRSTFVALCHKDEKLLQIAELLGAPQAAEGIAAFWGAEEYSCRFPDTLGDALCMGIDFPQNAATGLLFDI